MTIFPMLLRICVFLFLLSLATPLKIPEERVKLSVSFPINATAAFLDCPYELDDEGDENGLVIKWFYNDEDTPIFQWIPEEQTLPQAIGFIKDRLDVSHIVTNKYYSKHRALYIRDPTLDLNGVYTCVVSNFKEESVVKIELIVYVPANNFNLDFYETEEDSVTFICQADGVYPEPEIDLSLATSSDSFKVMDANVLLDFDNDTQAYNATIYKTYKTNDLKNYNYMECELTINGTDYFKYADATYFIFTGSLPSVSPTPDIVQSDGVDITEDNAEENLVDDDKDTSSTLENFGIILILFLSSLLLSSS